MAAPVTMQRTDGYDLIVIGGGSAGIGASTSAARWGAKVLLVERSATPGGDCTWTGCIPSKALLKCARVAETVRRSSEFGVLSSGPPTIDWAAVRSHWERSQQAIYAHDDSPEALAKKGVEVAVSTEAVFVSARELDLRPVGGEGMVRRATAPKFILCVGARPLLPASIEGLAAMDPVTSDTIWKRLSDLPRGIVVLGGGPIGCELAQAFARLGSAVTLVGNVLPRDSAEAQEAVGKALQRDGVIVEPGRCTSIERDGGKVVMVVKSQGASRTVHAAGDTVLCALGRSADAALRAVGALEVGVKHPSGKLSLDKYLRTTAGHVFAAGDCVGGMQFTHLAGYQGSVAGEACGVPLTPHAWPHMPFTKHPLTSHAWPHMP